MPSNSISLTCNLLGALTALRQPATSSSVTTCFLKLAAQYAGVSVAAPRQISTAFALGILGGKCSIHLAGVNPSAPSQTLARIPTSKLASTLFAHLAGPLSLAPSHSVNTSCGENGCDSVIAQSTGPVAVSGDVIACRCERQRIIAMDGDRLWASAVVAHSWPCACVRGRAV